MKYADVVATIELLGADSSLTFVSRSDRMKHLLDGVSEPDILEHLDHAGVIPESIGHDSTEEKLFAKYCDALLARSLSLIGMTSSVITERADAADVSATLDGYTVVGDAKAFRLSRTAKNQKDFKVEALNEWRKGADYAMLCSPLYQYPTTSSQIYWQATTYNVTLLSYTHLAFMIRNKPLDNAALKLLWEVSRTIPRSKDSSAYWKAVNSQVRAVCGASERDWEDALRLSKERLPDQAREQISYWEDQKRRVRELNHSEAVEMLITALKIDSKIETIAKNVN
jgi:type II restriction enzyme